MRRTRGWLGSVVLACVSLGLPELARAQAASGIETQPRSTWHFGISADGSWYENAYFLGPAGEDAAWSMNGRATLTRERRFKTGSFALSAFGGVIYYPEIDGFNQPTYGGNFALTWRGGQRTTLTLGQNFERTNTRYLNAVDAAGLPLPTSPATYATSSLGIEHMLSRHWQFAADGRFAYRRYDDELLVDSEQAYATASLGHQVGRHGQIYLGYGFSSSWFGSEKLRSHEVLLGGRRRPPPQHGTGFELAGGAGYVESTGQWYPAGRAGLTVVGRRASLALLYYRDFGQAYGYGRQVIGDLASVTASWAPARRFSLSADYNFGYRRDPADESYTIQSGIASGGFHWTVGGGVGIGGRYAWERNVTEGRPVVEGSRVTATLSYGVDWK